MVDDLGTPAAPPAAPPEAPPETPPEGTPPPSNWYADHVAGNPDRAETYARYKSADEFHTAFFDQRTKISQSLIPPDPASENYVSQVKQARLKLGAKANASEYTVTIPEDTEGLDVETFKKTVTERAVKFGVTQNELDDEVAASLEAFKIRRASEVESETAATQERLAATVAVDEALTELWGARKEAQMNNAVLAAKHYDSGLFSADNDKISQEVRAEKGGVVQQMLKNNPVMNRLLAVLYDQHLSEGSLPPGGRPTGGTPQTNLQVQRYEAAKARWPQRGHEVWDKYSKETR